MGVRRAFLSTLFAAFLVIALVPSIALAKLVVADYKFNDSLGSSVGSAAALSNVGAGNDFATETVRGESDRVLTFAEGNGLLLVDPGLVPNDDYSVVLAFRLVDLGTYDRILDTSGEVDDGLYQHLGALDFQDSESVDHEGPGGVIATGEYVEVGFTRSSTDRIAGYADGVQQFSYTDEFADENALIGSDGLRFFDDDDGAREAPGAVARIRLFRRALTADEVQQVFEGCTVPKVKGKKKKRAKKKLKNAGCSVGKKKKKFSDKVDKGRVIKQKPKKGAERDFEFGVKLVLSKGPSE